MVDHGIFHHYYVWPICKKVLGGRVDKGISGSKKEDHAMGSLHFAQSQTGEAVLGRGRKGPNGHTFERDRHPDWSWT